MRGELLPGNWRWWSEKEGLISPTHPAPLLSLSLSIPMGAPGAREDGRERTNLTFLGSKKRSRKGGIWETLGAGGSGGGGDGSGGGGGGGRPLRRTCKMTKHDVKNCKPYVGSEA